MDKPKCELEGSCGEDDHEKFLFFWNDAERAVLRDLLGYKRHLAGRSHVERTIMSVSMLDARVETVAGCLL